MTETSRSFREAEVSKKHKSSHARNEERIGDSSPLQSHHNHRQHSSESLHTNPIDELQRIKAQHRALIHGIVGALSRESLEDLLVEAASNNPELMNRIVVANSQNRYKASSVQDEEERSNSSKYKFVPTRAEALAYPSTRGLPWTEEEDQILIQGRELNLTFSEMQHKLPMRTKYGAQKRHKRLVELGRIAEHWDPKSNSWVVDRTEEEELEKLQNGAHHESPEEKDEMTLDDLLGSDDDDEYQADGRGPATRPTVDDGMSAQGNSTEEDEESSGRKKSSAKMVNLLSSARSGITEAKEMEQNIQQQLRDRHQTSATKNGWSPVNADTSDDEPDLKILTNGEKKNGKSIQSANHFNNSGPQSSRSANFEFDIMNADGSAAVPKTLFCPYDDCEAGPWSYKHKRDEHIKNKHTKKTEMLYCPYEDCTFGPWSYPHKRTEHLKAKHGADYNKATGKAGTPTASSGPGPAAGGASSGGGTPKVIPKTLYCPYEGCEGYGPWTYNHGRQAHINAKHAQEEKVADDKRPVAQQTFYCDIPGCKSSGPWVQHRTLKTHLLREHNISAS